MTRRKDLRAPVSLRIRYSESGGQSREAFTAFLGTGGCFILSTDPPGIGSRLRLEFTLPTLQRPMHLNGKVAWRRTEFRGSRQAGCGVEFGILSREDKQAIQQFVDAVLKRQA